MTRQKAISKNVRVKPGEQGYALLIVFLMAAAVAMSLYKEMPRIAFESMRNREQMLMDRGNQYTRAIQVFYQVNKRYPARLEDLEKTNEIRFLRRRYKDPMNGSEEWRLVHTNGSFLTDSLIEKPPQQNAQGGSQSQLPGSGPLGTNNMNTAAPAQPNPNDPNANTVNPAVMQRATDRRQPGAFMNGAELANGFVNPGQQNFPGQAFDPNNPSTWPSITLGPVGANGQPGIQMIEGQRNDGAGAFAYALLSV